MDAVKKDTTTPKIRNILTAFKKRRRVQQITMGVSFLIILVGGWLVSPLLGYFLIVCVVVAMGIGFSRGRKWCDWYCPRGSFYDAMMAPMSPSKKIPKIFKGLPLRIGVLSIFMTIVTIQIIKRWPDVYKIGEFFVILLTVTTAIGVVFSFIFHYRTWCCFCPVGSMTNWIGKNKYPLMINSEQCIDCKLCEKTCPMQIKPYAYRNETVRQVADGDCLKCNLCVKACPSMTLSFRE